MSRPGPARAAFYKGRRNIFVSLGAVWLIPLKLYFLLGQKDLFPLSVSVNSNSYLLIFENLNIQLFIKFYLYY